MKTVLHFECRNLQQRRFDLHRRKKLRGEGGRGNRAEQTRERNRDTGYERYTDRERFNESENTTGK